MSIYITYLLIPSRRTVSKTSKLLVQFWICCIYRGFSQFPSLPWLFFPSSPLTWRSRDMCDVCPYLLVTLSALRGQRGGVES